MGMCMLSIYACQYVRVNMCVSIYVCQYMRVNICVSIYACQYVCDNFENKCYTETKNLRRGELALMNTGCPSHRRGWFCRGCRRPPTQERVVLPRLSRPPHTGEGGFAEVVEALPQERVVLPRLSKTHVTT